MDYTFKISKSAIARVPLNVLEMELFLEHNLLMMLALEDQNTTGLALLWYSSKNFRLLRHLRLSSNFTRMISMRKLYESKYSLIVTAEFKLYLFNTNGVVGGKPTFVQNFTQNLFCYMENINLFVTAGEYDTITTYSIQSGILMKKNSMNCGFKVNTLQYCRKNKKLVVSDLNFRWENACSSPHYAIYDASTLTLERVITFSHNNIRLHSILGVVETEEPFILFYCERLAREPTKYCFLEQSMRSSSENEWKEIDLPNDVLAVKYRLKKQVGAQEVWYMTPNIHSIWNFVLVPVRNCDQVQLCTVSLPESSATLLVHNKRDDYYEFLNANNGKIDTITLKVFQQKIC